MTNMLENMIAVAKKAGKIVLNYYDQDYEVTTKFNDPKVFLTTADTESEKYIIHELTRIFPDYQIVSEEKGNNAIDFSKNVFIVDPLDGTRQFVQHKKNFSVIIGLCSNGIPLAGVVYLPKLDETYFAEKGYGAYIEYKGKISSIHTLKQNSLQRARVFNREPHHEGIQSVKLDALPAKKTVLDSATGYKICLIAKGCAEIFINTSQRTSKWDICAPQIILEEAGGKMTEFSGNPIDYKLPSGEINPLFFATNGDLHSVVRNFVSN